VTCSILIREEKLTSEQHKASLQDGFYNNLIDLLSTFKSRNYVCVTLVYLFAWTTGQFVQSNLLLHTKYVSRREEYFTFLILGM
jgi:Na+/melibiose symporter-like transporter